MTKIKTLSKKTYYLDQLEKRKKNARMLWDIIRTVLLKKLKQQQTNALEVNGSVTDDPFLVTNKFNRFLSEIGSKLANNIVSTSIRDPLKYLTNRASNSIFFNDPPHNETLNTIMFREDKAVGHDDISAFILKVARHVITSYLLIFIQFSFNRGIFSNNCKIARVVNICKISKVVIKKTQQTIVSFLY